MDLMIAATASIHRLPLVTYDQEDFAQLDDLIELEVIETG
jgi:predicted nucleic acid-binding protein